ncbi:hypothetical protein ABK040_008860 [Willaertia magna]
MSQLSPFISLGPLVQNATAFFQERYQETFLTNNETSIFYNTYLFLYNSLIESFANETGANAVIACFFFISLSVLTYSYTFRLLFNYLFKIKVPSKQVIAELRDDVIEGRELLRDDLAVDLRLPVNNLELDQKLVKQCYKVYKKADENNVWRKIFETAHYLITAMMAVVFIPYCRMHNYWTWMCFWSYCGMFVFILLTTVSRLRSIRRFAFKWIFFPAQGLMIVANFAYIYYDLATWSFGYVFVHFIPPVIMWIVLLLNIREFLDNSLNYTTSSIKMNGYNLMFYLVIVTYWRYVFNPLHVYSRIIEDVFLWACFLPLIVNIISFGVVSAARTWWFNKYGKHVIREYIVMYNNKQK